MSDPMKFKAVIKQDGTVVTEVLDRGQHLCGEVYKVTNAIGKQLSDEEIGPECDTVNEIIT
jgi:protein-arginine kinase